MAEALNISVNRRTILKPVNLVAVVYIGIAIASLQEYLSFLSASFVLAMVALPFVLPRGDQGSRSYRYAWVAFICAILCFFMPVKTLLYFTICFSLVLFAENFYGRTGLLLPAVILLASPVFQYITNIFSFPIRLQLTSMAGNIFHAIGYTVEVQGNIILYQGNEFSVDPACMGLNMMSTSLLLGVILIAYYQRKYNTRSSTVKVISYLSFILVMNIIANLFRIILLVHFTILPETISHDIAGIMCLLVYVIMPAVVLARLIARKSKAAAHRKTEVSQATSLKAVSLHLFMVSSVFLLSFKVMGTDTFSKFSAPSRGEIKGYAVIPYAPGITKLESDRALIYVKYIRGFYDTDHNPMICWKGSGYRFGKIEKENIAGREVFAASLIRDNDKLYSAWWFDNGQKTTIDQFQWRWDLLKGVGHYAVVNITCSSKEALSEEIQKIIQQQTLSPFFIK